MTDPLQTIRSNLENTMKALRPLALFGLFLFLFVNVAAAQDAKRYTVKQGDTLYRIATTHDLTVAELKRLNNLTSDTIRPGQELIVAEESPSDAGNSNPFPTLPDPVFEPARDPVAPRETSESNEATTTVVSFSNESEQPNRDAASFKPLTRAKRSYVVQPGDTYYSIAVEYGVPAYAIFAINGGKTEALEPNESIWIPDTDPITSFDDSDEDPTYEVRKGDTLYGIARKTGTTVQKLRDVNGLVNNALRIGQVITIPAPDPIAKPQDQVVPPLYETGPVTIYPDTFAGRITASGDPYDPARFTVSHPELALETIVLLTNPISGRSTFAEVTDRGPLDTRFVMDVSAIVARELALTPGQEENIQIRVVE